VIPRRIEKRARRLARENPVLVLTGPRQSGNTTFSRSTWSDLAYVDLENPKERRFAAADPVGFLARFESGAILDEIQNAPDLTSYLQVIVDARTPPPRLADRSPGPGAAARGRAAARVRVIHDQPGRSDRLIAKDGRR
jgi:hypothetical protein